MVKVIIPIETWWFRGGSMEEGRGGSRRMKEVDPVGSLEFLAAISWGMAYTVDLGFDVVSSDIIDDVVLAMLWLIADERSR